MAKRAKATGPVVGLDIGSRWIKAVEVRSGRGGATITGIGYEPTPEGAVVDDAIQDPAAVGAAVKRLFSGSGISCHKVVSAVSGQSSVVVRIIEVPRMTLQELAETMKWEVERHIPFPSSEVVMDYKPLNRPSEDPQSQTLEALLAVCQEEVLKRHMEMLSSAKLSPVAIEVESVAFPRVLIHGNPEVENYTTVAVADIGNSNTKVCIYEKKILVFPRSVPIAGINLIRAISQSLGVEESEAEVALREHGVADIELLNQLSQPAAAPEAFGGMAPGDETQQVSPFAPPPDMGEEPEPMPSPMPPPLGFDLGDEFVTPSEPASPFDLGGESETPKSSGSGGVFDLDSDMFSAPKPEPVFDLDDANEPEPEVEAVPAGIPAAVPVAVPPTADQAKIAEAIAPVLLELATELGRSLDYYSSRNPSPVEAVVLCGGVAKLPGLAGYLGNVLGVPVMVGDPLARAQVGSRRFSPEALAELAPVFSASVGLALRDMVGDAD